MITLYGLLWAAGGNDVLALVFRGNIYHITELVRVAVFVGPVLAFLVTRRWCLGLQRRDRDELLHGYESGVISRSVEGTYHERHVALSREDAYALTVGGRQQVPVAPAAGGSPEPSDSDGPAPSHSGGRVQAFRAWLSRLMFNPSPPPLRRGEVDVADADADLDGDNWRGVAAADGHQFDGRRPVEESRLRGD
jgi:ubiquinol-cytochrome c reductase cytochrome b subunit